METEQKKEKLTSEETVTVESAARKPERTTSRRAGEEKSAVRERQSTGQGSVNREKPDKQENPEKQEEPGKNRENPEKQEEPGKNRENSEKQEEPGKNRENPQNQENPGKNRENPQNRENSGKNRENPQNRENSGKNRENPQSQENPGKNRENPDKQENPQNQENPGKNQGKETRQKQQKQGLSAWVSTRMKNHLKNGGILSLIFLVLLAAFAFYVNREVKINALYMDDLYMWSFYGEESLPEFVFPFRTSTRFRPVYWFFAYLQMKLVGADVSGYAAFNIIVNIFLAWVIYAMGVKISRQRPAAFLASLVFLASRFSYYQIGQVLGYMETLACLFALLVLFFLYRYLIAPNDQRIPDPADDAAAGPLPSVPLFRRSDQRYFAAAMTAYVLVSFTHERFITLVPLFYLALVLKLLKEPGEERKNWATDTRFLWIVPAAAAAAIMLIRFIFIGRSIPAGTGGTQVTETFSLTGTLRFCLSQVLYLLGINDGPEYLCAIPWEGTPEFVRTMVKGSIVGYALLGLLFVISMFRDLKMRKTMPANTAPENIKPDNTAEPKGAFAAETTGKAEKKPENGDSGIQKMPLSEGLRRFHRKVAVSLLFAGFIAICIVSSSITIRLEMRWIYVSFAAMQLFACFMISSVAEFFRKKPAEAASGRLEENCRKPVTENNAGQNEAAEGDRPASAGLRMQGRNRAGLTAALFIYAAYAALSVGTNVYCRGYIDNIYFMEGQNRANNIAEETIYRFGAEDVLGRTVFLVGSDYEISDFYCEYFFRPYDPEKTGQGSRLVLVDTVEEGRAYAAAQQAAKDPIFLTEDPATGKYIVFSP